MYGQIRYKEILDTFDGRKQADWHPRTTGIPSPSGRTTPALRPAAWVRTPTRRRVRSPGVRSPGVRSSGVRSPGVRSTTTTVFDKRRGGRRCTATSTDSCGGKTGSEPRPPLHHNPPVLAVDHRLDYPVHHGLKLDWKWRQGAEDTSEIPSNSETKKDPWFPKSQQCDNYIF